MFNLNGLLFYFDINLSKQELEVLHGSHVDKDSNLTHSAIDFDLYFSVLSGIVIYLSQLGLNR